MKVIKCFDQFIHCEVYPINGGISLGVGTSFTNKTIDNGVCVIA